MRWYKDMYVGYSLLENKNQIIKDIKAGKTMRDKFLLTLPKNDYDTLEIYPSNILLQKWFQKSDDIVVIGVANGREEAMELMQLIVNDCIMNTRQLSVKQFILEKMGV